MSAQDLAEIAKGALLLPGGWHMDPVADIRQVGTVWVHPGPSGSRFIFIFDGLDRIPTAKALNFRAFRAS
jgi:hypothetical protein